MRYALTVIALLTCPASADDFNPTAQACMSKLLETTQREIEVRTQAITWQRDLVAVQVDLKAAQARVKMLEDKYEPKPAQEITK